MVYTGKPSRGCQTCKKRRIKCDEKRPICSQCQKSNRHCPGYPDEFDLVFRNENIVLERKARKAGRSGSQESPPSLSPSSSIELTISTSPTGSTVWETPSSQSQSETPSSATSALVQLPLFPESAPEQDSFWKFEYELPRSISVPPEVEATAFFFQNFVCVPQQAESMRGFLELIVPLYNQATPSSALQSATNAVALACCGHYPGRRQLIQEAVTAYGKALRRIKEDLKDPAMATSDETVLATLVFSLYEAIMSTNGSIKGWANHVDGAIALTKLRGEEQFKNPTSRAVFRAVRTLMITRCVQLEKPLDDFPGPHGWYGVEEHEENAANRLSLIALDLPALRSRAIALKGAPRTSEHEEEARSILELAKMIDSNLQEWSRTIPDDWHYRTTKMVYDMPEDVSQSAEWPGPQHTYKDVHIASIINDYRVCRIFCQCVLGACTLWLTPPGQDPQTKATFVHANFVIQQMVDEISACVPYHMNYDMQNNAQQIGQDPVAAEAVGAYCLVWPLYVAANTEIVPQRQRDWLSGRLFHIGTAFGLSSAQVLVMARQHVLTCGPMYPSESAAADAVLEWK